MRILVTADLHYRPKLRHVYLDFARWVGSRRPDCFIIAGDVGHPLRLFRRGLQLFADLDCPRLFIAGNHDVYRSDHDSRTLWETVLPRVAADEGFVWLEDRSVRLDGVGVCGTLGWYDYSSRAAHLPLTERDYRDKKHLVNHDADYVDWPWSDVAMARFLARGLDNRLAALGADPAVREVLVVTHVPIFGPAIPRHPGSDAWSLLNAYLGNLTLGRLVRRHPKVRHVVSGHVHLPGRWTVAGEHGPIDFQIVGSRKGAPAAVELQLGQSGELAVFGNQ